MPDTSAHDYGSRLINALEDAWNVIRTRHPQVPGVVVIAGRAAIHKDHFWGHFARAHARGPWTTPAGTQPELFVSGESVSEGGHSVMKTLLHEAAHGLASARGLQETSNRCRYHNPTFAALAEELGLRRPTKPHRVIGWSNCSMPDVTAQRYADVIAGIDAAGLPTADHEATYRLLREIANEKDQKKRAAALQRVLRNEDEKFWVELRQADPTLARLYAQVTLEEGGREGKRMACTCSCRPARRLQLTPRSLQDGAVLCGNCGKPFLPEAPIPAARRRGPTKTVISLT
ncbi:hypothetical protein [Streptomyces sp. NPDC085665]|uniref:hypothetical protein n=1 Tax=Streptomyces sp. NPDC085665 TaxID=3365735 RepID=UPI0037D435FE